MLELSFKSSFKGLAPDIPSRPLFAMHSLNPCHYPGPGFKIIQVCNPEPFIRPARVDDPILDNWHDFVTFWPPLKKSLLPGYYGIWDYMGFWLYQTHKHGSQKLFIGDFLQVALRLGKNYIQKIEDFMRGFISEYGSSHGGMFLCGDFRDKLERALKFKARVVFGWQEKSSSEEDSNSEEEKDKEKSEQPYILDLFTIQILLDLDLKPIDYATIQRCIEDPSYFMMSL
ncbi:uncharacterized protein LOC108223402 [Daucus carota subsp. sativus]|nr:PREDICTED: uncharacterized protein LOC108223402 [Daucus carota subsp. sativus]